MIDQHALDKLFLKARSHNAWLDKPVSDETLARLYDLAKWPPTSANSNPMRVVFVKSPEAKEKLKPCLDAMNVEKTMTAPVAAIIASDMTFYEQLSTLLPHNPAARGWFAGNDQLIEVTAMRNGSLQGAYLMLAARALGLDCGPISGFDNTKVDAAFFAGTSFKSNFLCNIGYGDEAKLFPRSPRFAFADACQIV